MPLGISPLYWTICLSEKLIVALGLNPKCDRNSIKKTTYPAAIAQRFLWVLSMCLVFSLRFEMYARMRFILFGSYVALLDADNAQHECGEECLNAEHEKGEGDDGVFYLIEGAES